MFHSKFFTVMIVLTFLFVAAALTIQMLDFNGYELFQSGAIQALMGK